MHSPQRAAFVIFAAFTLFAASLAYAIVAAPAAHVPPRRTLFR
jgi:hypothetical protein